MLTFEVKEAIKKASAEGQTQVSLARQYNLSQGHISRICATPTPPLGPSMLCRK